MAIPFVCIKKLFGRFEREVKGSAGGIAHDTKRGFGLTHVGASIRPL